MNFFFVFVIINNFRISSFIFLNHFPYSEHKSSSPDHLKRHASGFWVVLISLSKFNLPLIGTFTWPTPPGPYITTTCRGRELNYGSHTYFFDHTRTWRASPNEWSAQLRGPPPRQHKHERQYTHSTHSVIPTRRIWNDDDDGQMVFGKLGGLKFPDICLTGEEKPRNKPHPGDLSRPGIEPGPASWQARMLPLAPQRWTISDL